MSRKAAHKPKTLCECMHAFSEHMESWEEDAQGKFFGCTAFGYCRCEKFTYGGPIKPYVQPPERRTFTPPSCSCGCPRWRHVALPSGAYGACLTCADDCLQYDTTRRPPPDIPPEGPRGPRSKRMRQPKPGRQLVLRARAA